MRKHRCSLCCARWFVTIDGSECSGPDKIETSIYTDGSYSIFFPTTLTGSCIESAGAPIGKLIMLLQPKMTERVGLWSCALHDFKGA